MTKYFIENSKKLRELFHSDNLPAPDLIITSPPYFDVLNYENNAEQIGFGQDKYEEYLEDIVTILQSCYDISTPRSTLWLIIDTFKRNGETIALPFDIYHELKKRNCNLTWKLKEVIIWDKEKNLPWNGKGKFKNQFEYILFFSKTENFVFNIDKVREINDLKKWWKKYPERYNPDGKAPTNIWQFTTPLRGWGNGKQNHLCPFPFPLAEKIISLVSNPGDTVFDPFAGSGTVLALSEVMGRNSIGIDINEKYKLLFENEVISGAQEYWQKRIKEREINDKNILIFKKTNKELRKLKSTSNVCQYLNEINQKKFLFLAFSKSNLTSVDLWIISKDKIGLSIENKKLLKLLSQTKISFNIKTLSPSEAKSSFAGKVLHKYKFDKFYSFSSTTRIENIIKYPSDDSYTYFYSNISLKIP